MAASIRILGVVAAAVLAGTPAAFAEDYYAGKTINFIVGFAPGGGTDTVWRAVAAHIGKHIPGNPNIVVQNMEGGGGMNAANFVYEKARKDGLQISTGPWNSMGALTGAPNVRVDYTKSPFIGGFPEVLINFTRTDVVPGGLKNPADIGKAENLIVAGLRPDSSQDLLMRLSLDLLGVKYKYVPGYPGAAKRRAALLSGEAGLTSIGYSEFKASIEPTAVAKGDIMGLWYHSRGAVPSIKDVAHFPAFYEKVKGQKLSGEKGEMLDTIYLATGVFLHALFAPPGTDPEALKALKIGYERLMKDEEFQKFAMKTFNIPIDFVTTEEGEAAIQKLLGKPDKAKIERLQAYINEGSK